MLHTDAQRRLATRRPHRRQDGGHQIPDSCVGGVDDVGLPPGQAVPGCLFGDLGYYYS